MLKLSAGTLWAALAFLLWLTIAGGSCSFPATLVRLPTQFLLLTTIALLSKDSRAALDEGTHSRIQRGGVSNARHESAWTRAEWDAREARDAEHDFPNHAAPPPLTLPWFSSYLEIGGLGTKKIAGEASSGLLQAGDDKSSDGTARPGNSPTQRSTESSRSPVLGLDREGKGGQEARWMSRAQSSSPRMSTGKNSAGGKRRRRLLDTSPSAGEYVALDAQPSGMDQSTLGTGVVVPPAGEANPISGCPLSELEPDYHGFPQVLSSSHQPCALVSPQNAVSQPLPPPLPPSSESRRRLRPPPSPALDPPPGDITRDLPRYFASMLNAAGDVLEGSYRAGEAPLPDESVVANVRDFGAKGDGYSDDTQPFLDAIRLTKGPGVIFIPKGSYILLQPLVIRQPGIVLRGEGQTLTTVVFSRSMTDIYGNNWSGGGPDDMRMICFLGPEPHDKQGGWQLLSPITSPSPRTSHFLVLGDVSQIQEGDWVSIALDPAASNGRMNNLLRSLPLEWDLCPTCVHSSGEGGVLRFHSRVLPVWAHNSAVLLERALPFDVILEAEPKLYKFMAGIQNNGIKHLSLSMRWEPYHGHFTEAGWNGLEFSDLSNCWARNISIINSDNAIAVYRSSFCTITDIYIGVTRPRGDNGIDCHHGINDPSSRTRPRGDNGIDCHHGINVSASQDILVTKFRIQTKCYHDVGVFNYTAGVDPSSRTRPRGDNGIDCHHGINVSASQDILVTKFRIQTKCYHDVGVFNYTAGVVFASGSGIDLNMDNHRLYPYGTLWTNINVGAGTRPFDSSGLYIWGPMAGAFTTFWNIRRNVEDFAMDRGPPAPISPRYQLLPSDLSRIMLDRRLTQQI
eukprot:gene31086-6212_t